MDDALLERLDRMVEVMQRSPDFEGMEVSRSTAIRALVLRGLAAFEMRLGVTSDLPVDHSLATEAYWNRREQEAEQELEAIRRFIDEWESRKWNEYFEQVGEVPDWPESPPRSQHYKSKLKK